MRRPPKPFVTEYKAGNRRPKDGTGAFGTDPEAHEAEAAAGKSKGATHKTAMQKTATRGKTSEQAGETNFGDAKVSAPRQDKGAGMRRGEATRETSWANDTARFASGQGEDSYEAAMRAADALFSAPPTRQDPTPAKAETETVSSTPSAEAPAPPAGRILRAIDEPPDTTLADIEAERAPKRRGRKPGSKNKPKVPLATTHVDVTDAATDEDDDDVPVYPAPPTPRPSATIFPIIASRGEERFAWIRTKLGPGEQWKRRLPKVIW